ncbi:tetratricopeptide repeat-containing sulfotransferase family protein [Marilutibacter chinensis]|uniref:Sulfotransferase n=1 Tax=Marilutibacter chinensis TaxID=2912247 RepID=A0ABS9HVK7_9GAMM|nr:tetratricopeptide repeat-containing sulfotransferase family protein [Lysobacter chinensis]MCF7222536.1 sulfotransferase [Lysobacter chinensis]
MSAARFIDVNGYGLRQELAPRWQAAIELARRGATAEAAATMLAIAEAQPEFLPARLQAGYFLLAAGRYRQAAKLARELATHEPHSLESGLHLVRLLRRFEAHALIEAVMDRLDYSDCRNAPLLGQLASELGPIGLYRHAEALLARVSAIAPGVIQGDVLRGTIAMTAGRQDEADALLRRAIARSATELPHARWLLTLQPRREMLDADIAGIRAALDRVRAGSEDEAYLQHGLHNLLHAAKDTAGAWRALERGCAVKRELEPYDRVATARLFDALMAMPPAGAGSAPPSSNPVDAPAIVFIVGMYRSGTSVVERVLAGHPEVADGGESYVFPAALREVADCYRPGLLDAEMVGRLAGCDLAEAGELFRAHARWRAAGRRVFTEKLPSNFLNVDFILRALPEARIVHMCRDPIDTCFSNLRTYFSSHDARYASDQSDLADYYRRYRALMTHWHRRHPGRILDVDYHAFVDSPAEQAGRLMEFCGLDFMPETLDIGREGGHSATASIGSVRQGIQRNRGGAWRAYREYLDPLIEGLDIAGS